MSDAVNTQCESMCDHFIKNLRGPVVKYDVGSKITTRIMQDPAAYCEHLNVPNLFELEGFTLTMSPDWIRRLQDKRIEELMTSVTL